MAEIGPNSGCIALYHYTTPEGLLGLLQERKIWATHFAYLNDTSEINYANSLLENAILERLEKASLIVAAILKSILKTPNGLSAMVEPYVACFCEDGDLLSQWRAYSGKGGYALELLPRGIQVTMAGRGYTLHKIQYDEPKQKRLISAFLDKFCAALDACGSGCHPNEIGVPYIEERLVEGGVDLSFNLPEELGNICRVAIDKFAKIAPCLKNPKFRSEQEWRIIHIEPKFTRHANYELRFRTAGPLIVPYIELDLWLEGDDWKNPEKDKANFSLKSIVLGPNLHPVIAKRALELRIAQSGIRAPITISGSDIPVKL